MQIKSWLVQQTMAKASLSIIHKYIRDVLYLAFLSDIALCLWTLIYLTLFFWLHKAQIIGSGTTC